MHDLALSAIELFSGTGMLGEGVRAMTPIPGFVDLYSATDDGRIYSHVSNKFLSQSKSGRYAHVSLGSGRSRRVHELILETFRGPRPSGYVGRHLNGNSHDNNLLNLEWSTQSQNILDKVAHGTMPRGMTHPMRKMTQEQVIDLLRCRAQGDSYPMLAAKFGISKSQAHRIATYKNWKGASCG